MEGSEFDLRLYSIKLLSHLKMKIMMNCSYMSGSVFSIITPHDLIGTSISYVAMSGIYCILTIYNYLKFKDKINEIKAIIQKNEKYSETVKTWLDDVSSLEENLQEDNDRLIVKLNEISEENEDRRINSLIGDINYYIKRIKDSYLRILHKYKNCLNQLKKDKNWWQKCQKIGFGSVLIGVGVLILSGILATTGIISLIAPAVAIGGIGLSTIGTNFAASAERDCDELIRQINVIIKGYKNQKNTRLDEILKIVKEIEENNSKDDHAKKLLFKEIKIDIMRICGEEFEERDF